MKYILVSGGVISGVGKGIVTSSIGTILKSLGLGVTAIKIDPYLNIDAGTFSPFEHGETFVLNDGGEVDLDLGNYERFLDITLQRDNNITTGKIYQSVIAKERKGDYLGKTVQVVPHITNEIQDWVERQAKVCVDGSGKTADVCVVELGGTIGDIESMPYAEAFRQFQFRVGKENFCSVHVSLVPLTTGGEQKTKPTQASVRDLRALGILPDAVVCRCKKPLDPGIKEKIALFCNVDKNQVISVHDCPSVYHVPLLLKSEGLCSFLLDRLNLTTPVGASYLNQWRRVARRWLGGNGSVTIAVVGKYVKLSDSYVSVVKAIRHAAIRANVTLTLNFIEAEDLMEQNSELKDTPHQVQYHDAWSKLCSSNGILVPGGFGSRGVEGKVAACKYARTQNKPFLGICLGMQSAVIEYARNVLNWSDANSTEFVGDKVLDHPVVIDMPEHNTGTMGGTMRLGLRETAFDDAYPKSVTRALYACQDKQHATDFPVSVLDCKSFKERHRHRYEVNPKYIDELSESDGLQFVGKDIEEGNRMEVIEIKDHPYYVGLQAHPEFLSRPLKPSPPYLGLILAAASPRALDVYLKTGTILYDKDLDDDSFFTTNINPAGDGR